VRRDTDMSFRSPAGAGARGRFETVLEQMAGPWWIFLVTGIVWLVIALIVLRFRLSSVVAVGVLMGVVFLAASSSSPQSDRGGAGRTC
jgi:glycerol-3-phosphate acyltransferase PlsY